jgi:hypothetical protein
MLEQSRAREHRRHRAHYGSRHDLGSMHDRGDPDRTGGFFAELAESVDALIEPVKHRRVGLYKWLASWDGGHAARSAGQEPNA